VRFDYIFRQNQQIAQQDKFAILKAQYRLAEFNLL